MPAPRARCAVSRSEASTAVCVVVGCALARPHSMAAPGMTLEEKVNQTLNEEVNRLKTVQLLKDFGGMLGRPRLQYEAARDAGYDSVALPTGVADPHTISIPVVCPVYAPRPAAPFYYYGCISPHCLHSCSPNMHDDHEINHTEQQNSYTLPFVMEI